MKKVMIVFMLSLIISFSGCRNESSSKNQYNLEKFENDMNDKGYDFEIQDVAKDFLPTTRKRMILDDIALDIYIFSSNKKMENEASNINNDGFGYNNGSKAMQVSWISNPHFYKRGNIIVQYVGESKTILSELTEIFGEQFAGQKIQ